MLFDDLTPRWKRAVKRAAIRGTRPKRFDDWDDGGLAVRRYRVASDTRLGVDRVVRIAVSADQIEISCTCEASLGGQICWHCGSVLISEGWTDEPALDTEQVQRIKGKQSLVLLNGEFDEVDRLETQLATRGRSQLSGTGSGNPKPAEMIARSWLR
jgi:hypothetical protein